MLSKKQHMLAIGELLWKQREKRECSLREMAALLAEEPEAKVAYPDGLGRQAIYQWEHGVTYPPHIMYGAICRVLDITPEQLVMAM